MLIEEKTQWIKNALITFLTIFLCNGIVITCSMTLFFRSVDYTEEQIRSAAPATFVVVVLISLLFVIIHLTYNHFNITKPAKRIQKGLQEITDGNLSARINPAGTNVVFDSIIDSINIMAEELSTVETLKTDFISNVSHEIKTPISVIQNYSRLLQMDTLSDEKREECAGAIYMAAGRLNELVANILKLNRLEHQQITLNRETMDVGRQVTETLLTFETIWTDKEIEVIPEIEDDVFVNSDPELLNIIWSNLLSNAFKFTEPGGRVEITVRADGGYASVAVSDTGCGISQKTGAHIFDKFYQGDTSHATQGNGLGLALVKQIIDIAGGEILVDSIPGQGSTFTVRIRRCEGGAV